MKRIFILFLSLFALIGCQSTPSNQNLKDGTVTRMEKVKNYDGLIRHYKSELEQNEHDPKVKEKLAKAYFQKGDIESANFYVQYLRKKGIKTASLYQLEGQIFDADNKTENAINAYLSSIQSGNQSGHIHLLLGVSYAKLGKYDEAYDELNNARLRGYDDLAIKNNIAMIHMAKNEYEKAIGILAPALRSNPENEVLKSNLAIALMRDQQIDVAKQLLEDDFSKRELNSIASELGRSGVNYEEY
jgi:tight adherence protein D